MLILMQETGKGWLLKNEGMARKQSLKGPTVHFSYSMGFHNPRQ